MGLTIKTIPQNRVFMDYAVLGIANCAFIVSYSEMSWENIFY